MLSPLVPNPSVNLHFLFYKALYFVISTPPTKNAGILLYFGSGVSSKGSHSQGMVCLHHGTTGRQWNFSNMGPGRKSSGCSRCASKEDHGIPAFSSSPLSSLCFLAMRWAACITICAYHYIWPCQMLKNQQGQEIIGWNFHNCELKQVFPKADVSVSYSDQN